MSRSSKADRDAEFAAFMRQAEPSLMRTAWLLTGSTDAARELVQASLVKTYASWSKVRPETALAFTRRVLVNHKVDVWRARSREVLGGSSDRPAVVGSGVSDDRDEIVRLLARLPEQQRKVVVLRYYADLSEQATAEALGVSVGTVKSTASRALATLRGLAADPRAPQRAVASPLPPADRETPGHTTGHMPLVPADRHPPGYAPEHTPDHTPEPERSAR